MHQTKKSRHIKLIISFGLIYLAIGILSALITNPIESTGIQAILRLFALALAIVAFAYHIRLELFQNKNSVLKAALYAAIATALSTFLLAVLANIYIVFTAAENKGQLPLALIVWPTVTCMLAFLGGSLIAKIFSILSSRRK
jgi:hypothetical protein